MAPKPKVLQFIARDIKAKFKEFTIPPEAKRDLSVVVPTVKGKPLLKYGAHSYSFYNFSTLKGFTVSIGHQEIIRFKPAKLKRAEWSEGTPLSKAILKRYHYNFSFIEQMMLMTVPHTVTSMGNGRFLINLWAYFGYLDIDCRKRRVTYRLIDDKAYKTVLGSQQYYHSKKDELYYAAYSMKESLSRIDNASNPVHCSVFKQRQETGRTSVVWSGEFADFVHDIVMNKQGTLCALPELGLYTDKTRSIVPSKALILDLGTGKTWTIDRFSVAAHAQFDPKDPRIVYFSNHNFNFEHTSLLSLLKKATYTVKFKGPASVYKYRITPKGPKKVGVFTRSDFYRLTNFHVFDHRGKTVIAALGFPDVIFIVDAEKMSYIKKVKVRNQRCGKAPDSKKPALIGTFSPSLDGEKLYVQTTRSFQVLDIAKEDPDMVVNHFFNRTCSNHMLTSADTDW